MAGGVSGIVATGVAATVVADVLGLVEAAGAACVFIVEVMGLTTCKPEATSFSDARGFVSAGDVVALAALAGVGGFAWEISARMFSSSVVVVGAWLGGADSSRRRWWINE